jgi:hypothetical protein
VQQIQANGFDLGSATIPYWPTTIQNEALTMYINIISSQLPHHSANDVGRDGLQNTGLLFTTDMACYPREFYQIIIACQLDSFSVPFTNRTDSG